MDKEPSVASYKVLSDRVSLASQGQTIDSAALDGYNVDALLAGGHLEEVNPKAVKTESTDISKDTK